jgi:hypothetical protein
MTARERMGGHKQAVEVQLSFLLADRACAGTRSLVGAPPAGGRPVLGGGDDHVTDRVLELGVGPQVVAEALGQARLSRA